MPDEIDLLRMFRGETPEPSTDAWNRAAAAITAAQAEEGATPAEEAVQKAARTGYGPARSRKERAGQRAKGAPRRRLIQAVGGLAAAAAVGGLLAALLPASGGQQAETAALVADVSNALTAASSQGNLVEYARTVYTSGDIAVSAGSTVTWTYRNSLRITIFDAGGRPVSDQSTSFPKGGARHEVTVDYSDATWWQTTLGPAPAATGQAIARGCHPAPPAPGTIVSSGGWPALIGGLLGCGALQMGGRQWVDGIDAIKLDLPDGSAAMWIDPVTNLPVRAIITFGNAGAGAVGPAAAQQALTDFRWLSPTPANLAQLTATIPPGFRQVSAPS
jgi:hypothetical protein